MKEKGDVVKRKSFTIKKVAIFILAIISIAGASVYAQNNIKEFTNKKILTTVSISDSINNGFAEKINMDYTYSDGIGLRIKSIFMSDNDIGITLDFDLNGKINLNQMNSEFGDMLKYGYILYNENKEVYCIDTHLLSTLKNKNLISEFKKENNIKHKDIELDGYWSSMSSQYETFTNKNIVITNLLQAKEIFPKAKKLYLRLVGIGYENEKGKYKSFSNSNWLIELDIPSKFYTTTVKEYKLKDFVKGINLERAIITDTSMTVIATIDGINGNTNTCIIDENGKEYKSEQYEYSGIKGDRLTLKFPINKNMIPNKLYLKTYVNSEEKIIELLED